LVLPASDEEPFAELVVDDHPAAGDDDRGGFATISIETSGIVVRVPNDISASRLAEIVMALRLA